MSKITFEQLLARREQREQDKYRVGLLTIPGAGERPRTDEDGETPEDPGLDTVKN